MSKVLSFNVPVSDTPQTMIFDPIDGSLIDLVGIPSNGSNKRVATYVLKQDERWPAGVTVTVEAKQPRPTAPSGSFHAHVALTTNLLETDSEDDSVVDLGPAVMTLNVNLPGLYVQAKDQTVALLIQLVDLLIGSYSASPDFEPQSTRLATLSYGNPDILG